MTDNPQAAPTVIEAVSVPIQAKSTNYPEPFASRMTGRQKRRLGEVFGLRNFGVNLTRLMPGGQSALFHRHARQDEFIYVLEGAPTLVTEHGEVTMGPGQCAGFPAAGTAHQLVNRTAADVVYLEVGDRTPEDGVEYPRDDIQALLDAGGKWVFTHKDGTPY